MAYSKQGLACEITIFKTLLAWSWLASSNVPLRQVKIFAFNPKSPNKTLIAGVVFAFKNKTQTYSSSSLHKVLTLKQI